MATPLIALAISDMPQKAMPKGNHGSWCAEYKGRKYACVHEDLCVPGEDGKYVQYIDKEYTGRGRWKSLEKEINAKLKVLVTKSHWKEGVRRRKGYLSLWEIKNVSITGGILQFDFIQPIENLE
jgi:hypothetical protein